MSQIADKYYDEKFPQLNGYRYKLTSKDGTFSTYDYLNKSGELTEYVKNILGISVISSYRRRALLEKFGELWWEPYFDVTTEPIKEVKKCPYCGWETVDINNNSGAFEIHLKKTHGLTKELYLKEHPEDKEYFTLVNKTQNRLLETDEEKFVACKICGKKLARIDWKHLQKHGITKEEYILKYGPTTTSKELHDKLSKLAIKTNGSIEPKYTLKPEIELNDYIKSLGVVCLKNRSILCGKELDMYLPDYKLAIEFDGNKYHTERFGGKDKYYHLNKTNMCKNEGINLIHIFEDEYYLKTNIVLSKIRHLLHMEANLQKIPGRKCEIKEINKKDAFEFLEKYHIQGPASSSVYLGALYNGNLIAVMSFKKENKNSKKWELNRFASDYNYILQGVGGKIFKYFINAHSPLEIKSFLDRRWCSSEISNIYTKLGFKFDRYTQPEYRYYNSSVNRYKRFHKFNFRKQILHKKYNLPLTMTENEMTKQLGYDKIWDCGLIKYVWKKEKAQENS